MRNIKNRVGYRISTIAHLIQNTFNQKLTEFDVTVSQARVLYLLVNYGEQQQAELQQRLYIKASTMNGILDSMIKRDLITRRDSTTDRRSKIISLTQKGQVLEDQLWQCTGEIDEEFLQGFTAEEKTIFLQLLAKLETNLQKKG